MGLCEAVMDVCRCIVEEEEGRKDEECGGGGGGGFLSDSVRLGLP